MPVVAQKALKKTKICPIKAAIAKVRLTKPSLDYNFKKPLSDIDEVTLTLQRQINCNLAPYGTPSKSRGEPADEIAKNVNEILQQRMFLPMISPIKELDEKSVIKTPKLKLHKTSDSSTHRLIDEELKNFIDNFASNIEDLASGEGCSKKLSSEACDFELFEKLEKRQQTKKTNSNGTNSWRSTFFLTR